PGPGFWGRNPGRGGAARRSAFDALYLRLQREVWALAYSRWMDADIALDITQEAFLRLWKQWQTGEEIQNPRAWLMRVARNLAEDYVKSAFRRNGTHPPQLMNGVRAPEWSPLESLQRDESFPPLHPVLHELSESDRQLLTLRYAFDYDAGRIAEALGINTTAVHMRLSRARQRLAERLNAEEARQSP